MNFYVLSEFLWVKGHPHPHPNTPFLNVLLRKMEFLFGRLRNNFNLAGDTVVNIFSI